VQGTQICDRPIRTEATPKGYPVAFLDAAITKRLAESSGEIQSLPVSVANVPIIAEHLKRDIIGVEAGSPFKFREDVGRHKSPQKNSFQFSVFSFQFVFHRELKTEN
jgi:hypothetical protein